MWRLTTIICEILAPICDNYSEVLKSSVGLQCYQQTAEVDLRCDKKCWLLKLHWFDLLWICCTTFYRLRAWEKLRLERRIELVSERQYRKHRLLVQRRCYMVIVSLHIRPTGLYSSCASVVNRQDLGPYTCIQYFLRYRSPRRYPCSIAVVAEITYDLRRVITQAGTVLREGQE